MRYVGAGILASLASLKVGAGYSIINTPENILTSFSNLSPDLIYTKRTNNIDDILKSIENLKINSIVLGCGLGTEKETVKFVKALLFELKNSTIPIVIDADGLNCISISNISIVPQNTILTPHPMELSRLLNIDIEKITENREKYINLAVEKYNSTVILKGNKTLIADKQEIYQNTTGNTARSKAGTGDILSGMIGGFLAQNAEVIDAGILGVYLHGLAGELYSNDFSQYSMLASDLLNYIPLAIKDVLN
jgi:NAD(P)H-hydrate epimerase